VTASPAVAGEAETQEGDSGETSGGEASQQPGPVLGEYDTDDLMAVIRAAFGEGSERDRERAIGDVAEELGVRRLSDKARHTIDHALRNAVRRGVVYNDDGILDLDCRTIEDYPREMLREALLAAMDRTWWDREDAMRATARYLGFRRTGSRIKRTLKSIITGLLRMDLLEAEGNWVRKTKST
jgi:hypothetical protein